MTLAAIIGALLGLGIGIADYVLLGVVKERIRRQAPTERLGAGLVIEIVRISQLIFFPIAGWFVGAYLIQ